MKQHAPHSIYLLVAAACCAASTTACTDPDFGHVQWDSLTETEVVDHLGTPTGQLKLELSPSDRAALQQPLPGLLEAAHYLGSVLTTIDELAQQDNSAIEEELPSTTYVSGSTKEKTWSTNLYVKLACPGDALDPPYDFDNGELRLDSPDFKGLDFLSLIRGGEFLMSFDKCDLGPLDFSAHLPGKYLDPQDSLIAELFEDPDLVPLHFIALDMSKARNSSLGMVAIACGSQNTDCNDDVLVAAEVKITSDKSYVLWFRGSREMWFSWQTFGYTQTTTVDVGIIAENGRARCVASYDITGATLDCEQSILD